MNSAVRGRRAWRMAVALALAALTLAGLAGGCLEGGGTSSETVGMGPGTVSGTMTQSGLTGRTDAGNFIGIYAADYRPQMDSGFADSLVAGSDGSFAFTGLAAGSYHLLVRRPADGQSAFITDITIPNAANPAFRGSLEPTGMLHGTITDFSGAEQGLVYVPGSPFFAAGDSLLHYSLTGVPAGNYRVIKTWTMIKSCPPPLACGGRSYMQDSSALQIRAGENSAW